MTEELDFKNWCESLGITNDPLPVPVPLPPSHPVVSPATTASHSFPPTPALDFSHSNPPSSSSSVFDLLGTPSDSFLAGGPTPFDHESATMDYSSLFGPWVDPMRIEHVSDQWGYAEAGAAAVVVARNEDEQPKKPKPAKRSSRAAGIYNGSGFKQNPSQVSRANAARNKKKKEEEEGAPPPPRAAELPTDPKARKKEINRLQAEKSRMRKRDHVVMLEGRVERLEAQVRALGFDPVA
ncbi:hypothetical protein RQP46_003549 [Phenoliferia psychrophenolica]